MIHTQPEEPVHVTGEERPHPALRKLGRACIALARWQREQVQPDSVPAGPGPDEENPASRRARSPAMEGPATPDQERRHD